MFILLIKQNKPGGKCIVPALHVQLPPWWHHPTKNKSPHFKGLGKMQLWLTHGEQQPHPISQMCLFITILFLGGVERGFPFSRATPCSDVRAGASPAPASASLPPTPFFHQSESPQTPLVPLPGNDVFPPLRSGISHMSNSLAPAPAVAAALRGPGFPPAWTGPDSSASALFTNPL